MRKAWHLLPDGTTTQDTTRYVEVWRALGALIAPPGFRLSAFDPDLLLVAEHGRSITVDPRLAMHVAGLLGWSIRPERPSKKPAKRRHEAKQGAKRTAKSEHRKDGTKR